MTEFDVFCNSISRMWSQYGGKCKVEIDKTAKTIDVFDYWGYPYLSFRFDETGELIDLENL